MKANVGFQEENSTLDKYLLSLQSCHLVEDNGGVVHRNPHSAVRLKTLSWNLFPDFDVSF